VQPNRPKQSKVKMRLTASDMSFHFSPPALPTYTKKDQQLMHVHKSRTTTSDKLKARTKEETQKAIQISRRYRSMVGSLPLLYP
jgi:hypothetical protein